MNKQMSSALVQGNQIEVILVGKDGQAVETICSTEVAEMVEKEHKNLLQDIRGYEQQITLATANGELKTQPTEYFIKSTYFSNQNKELPCYQITKKGCEFIASKLNGYKGTVFSTKYIDRFHEMEDYIKEKQVDTSQLSPHLQMANQILQQLAQSELAQKQLQKDIRDTNENVKAVSEKVEAIKEVVALDTTSWREETTNLINKIATYRGGTHNIYQETRREAYELLDKRFGVNLEQRLTNKRRRMAEEGICKSKRDKLSKLDVIADDKKLIEGYVAVVKDMAIKYGAI